MKCDAALSVTYTGNTKEQLDNMLTALDSVIGVLILSAGMLAFVVLYNLNNINIMNESESLRPSKCLDFMTKKYQLTFTGKIFC